MTTLEETLLQKLAKWRPDSQQASSQSLELADPVGGWNLTLKADHVDVVGLRLEELTLTRSAPQAFANTLADRAQALADRVHGLLEPLGLVEVDNVAQLRSASPARKGDELSYYELLLHEDGAVNLRRYHTSRPSARREQIRFTLTHEALTKLIRDLMG